MNDSMSWIRRFVRICTQPPALPTGRGAGCIVLSVSLLLLSPAVPSCRAEISDEARNLFRQAMELNRRGDYARALDYFLKARKIAPEILAQDDQGLLENATNFLKVRVERQPDSTDANFQLAELLALRGMDREALRYYKAVVKLAPGQALAVLSQTEIDRLEKNLAQSDASGGSAPPGQGGGGGSGPGTGAPGPGRGGSTSNRTVAVLKQRIVNLQKRVAQLQRELKEQKRLLNEEKNKNKSVKKDYEELKKQSSRWKLYYTLYMSALSQGKITR